MEMVSITMGILIISFKNKRMVWESCFLEVMGLLPMWAHGVEKML